MEIELGQTVVFVGPNNSGKTTALQAIALWEIGLRKWMEKAARRVVSMADLMAVPFPGDAVTINRRDLIAVPVSAANLLWHDLRLRRATVGKSEARRIRFQIAVSGVSKVVEWNCGFEFDYANEESLYCRPTPRPVPEELAHTTVAFLPAMSGIATVEDRLEGGAVNARIGEGRTAEVLRNLCLQVYEAEDKVLWTELVSHVKVFFGVTLNPPEFIKERGQITMSYQESGIELDFASSGRGLQQTVLLLAHLYTHPGSVLLLDEPDAHLEILRQRQIYQLLTRTAEAQGCQVIAASHSEVLLNEAAERDMVIAFVGKPHRIDDRGGQLVKSLRSIGFDQYYQAEQTGWVLYLEGSTDLAILQSFAESLDHPAKAVLEKPFVHYAGNVPSKAKEHFFGLREAKPDLVGVAIFDSIPQTLDPDGPLCELKWRQREIENYLCFPETLLAYGQEAPMKAAIDEVSSALRTLRRPDPFGPDIKASDDFLGPVFQNYFEKLGQPNLMRKTDYHVLARLVPRDLIDAEVSEKLNRIVEVAGRARPVS